MKIVFVSDAFHLHQKGVADALYNLTKGSYCFITTLPLREERKNMGFDNIYPRYVFDASSRTPEVWRQAQKIIDEAEVVVLGSAPYRLLKYRLRHRKLTFRYSERLLKGYKHFLKIPIYMLDNYKTKDCYLLCSSAFAASDYNRMGSFKKKCYKWGYFTMVDILDDLIEKRVEASPDVSISKIIPLMWCSRFLMWKHPELPILMAERLKKKGYNFYLDMFGTGEYMQKAESLAKMINVSDVVSFKGNVPNEQLMLEMRNHSIFLFTSDCNEGWGAVANEAMSNGCAIVASDEIGSVPYLVQDKENGCTFKSSSRLKGFGMFGLSVDNAALDSLVEKVEWLINNPNERKRISLNAIRTMQEIWNPKTAAENLLKLINDIQQGRDTSIIEGPCSKA